MKPFLNAADARRFLMILTVLPSIARKLMRLGIGFIAPSVQIAPITPQSDTVALALAFFRVPRLCAICTKGVEADDLSMPRTLAVS